MSPTSGGRTLVLGALLLACAGPPALARDKTDRLILVNGDTITGEIKSLDRGMLQYSTDGAGTLNVEWDDVVRLTSTYYFEIQLTDGELLFGSLAEPSADGHLAVDEAKTENREMALFLVVRIAPIEAGFLQKVDGSLSAGFSFTSASDVSQLSFAGSATYRRPRFEGGSSFSAITTEQESGTTSRSDLEIWSRRIFQHWYTGGQLSFEQNEELGIDLRVVLSGGSGRYLVRTNKSRSEVNFGLAINEEWVIGSTESQSSLEAYFGGAFEVFRYDSPKTDLNASLIVYPSLSEWGRIRADADITLRHEIITDFFADLTLYDTYDSEPPSGGAGHDYGLVISLGWTF